MVFRVVALLLAIAVAGPAVSPAQSPPFSCADTVRAALGGFEGNWRVEATFRAGESGWDSTRATSTFTADLSGCLLREDYRGTRYGQRYDFIALWGANGMPDARVQRFFSHSQHGIMGLAAGGFQGDTLVLNDNITLNGIQVLQQYRFTRPSAGRFQQLNRRSNDGGSTWIVTQRASYRRQ
jgi:hypothetical protein